LVGYEHKQLVPAAVALLAQFLHASFAALLLPQRLQGDFILTGTGARFELGRLLFVDF
jgi:hypothetical protein